MKNLPLKIRSKKLESRVYLTAMVSVSFLLIVFFMVTIDLAKANSFGLGLPYDDEYTCRWYGACGGENRSVTILLGDNNKLITYTATLALPIAPPREIEYGKMGLGHCF